MQREFSALLTFHDQKTHVAHRLDLPRGASILGVHLEHSRGAGLGHLICLSVFDANGFRGSGHRGATREDDGLVHEVRISAAAATPGYLPGPVAAGELLIFLHAHRIVPGEPCRYRLTVAWEEGTVAAEPRRPPSFLGAPRPPRRVGPGWYRGDLHAHTRHSDGAWDVPDLLREARDAGLDFVALTDHNTTSPLADIGELPDARPLVIPGMELTTFHGHALSLGTRDWIDWGVLRPDAMDAAAADVGRLGGVFVIAHPMAGGDPGCTGCDWRYEAMMPGEARAVEIWNGRWAGDSNNERALALWYSWLDRGLRMTATAGSDAHDHGRIAGGNGRNVAGAAELSARAILDAIAAGRLYLSAGPAVELTAGAGGRAAGIGDTLNDGAADLRMAWQGCPAGAVARLVTDGRTHAETPAGGDGALRWSGIRARWCVVELRDRAGGMLALTNPVYLA